MQETFAILNLNGYRKSPQISFEDYILWRDLIQERLGIFLKEKQSEFLQNRLWRRMRQLSVREHRDYYELVNRETHYDGEWRELIELLVNCESSFFRDFSTFEALMDNVLPELAEICLQRGDHLLTMWSAGCSRGQEAYSLAMACAQVFGDEGDFGISVTGTDISLDALTRAMKGEYTSSEIRHMSHSFIEKFLTQVKNGGDSQKEIGRRSGALKRHQFRHRVKENIRRNVEFGFMNLCDVMDYWIPLQHVIFCQNVLIYFRLQGRAETILMLLKNLKPGGYLFLAPGEALGIEVRGATPVRFKDIQVYKRNEEAVDVQICQ